MEEMKLQHANGKNPLKAMVELDGKPITIAMLLLQKEAKKTKGSQEEVLKKLTYLHLEGKSIELVKNLNLCSNLSHIYLQENSIYTLVNEPFKGLSKLVQLSLYDNRIDQMEGFTELVNLKKLYLEKNMIKKLDGLENCRKLEELYIGNQELASNVRFEFDEYSLAAISSTLRTLDIPNANVENPRPLYYLEGLDSLNLRDNLIDDFEQQVCPILQTMNTLKVVSFKNNPVTSITKYRD